MIQRKRENMHDIHIYTMKINGNLFQSTRVSAYVHKSVCLNVKNIKQSGFYLSKSESRKNHHFCTCFRLSWKLLRVTDGNENSAKTCLARWCGNDIR